MYDQKLVRVRFSGETKSSFVCLCSDFANIVLEILDSAQSWFSQSFSSRLNQSLYTLINLYTWYICLCNK